MGCRSRQHTFQNFQRRGEAREEVRVVLQALLVGLEVPHIDRVEADERVEQAEVEPGEGVAAEEPSLAEASVDLVERGEEVGDGLVVGRLRLGEATAVDAVIDIRVDDRFVERLEIRLEAGRVQIDVRALRQVVE